VVIPAIGELKGLGSACRELMHSYHNVAELRQFHDHPTAKNNRLPAGLPAFTAKGGRHNALAAAPADQNAEIPDRPSQRIAVVVAAKALLWL
jgi:hypothetical protein